jgi:hypothetical protein
MMVPHDFTTMLVCGVLMLTVGLGVAGLERRLRKHVCKRDEKTYKCP